MDADKNSREPIAATMDALGCRSMGAVSSLSASSGEARNGALSGAARAIRERAQDIRDANAADMAEAKSNGLTAAMLDRLMLDDGRIEAMAVGLESIVELPDPLGRVLAEWDRPNGLRIQRVAVPLGVIGIIYESRPNVTADAAGLCIKSGNAVILRGGSESYRSSHTIYACMRKGLEDAGIDPDAVQMVPTTDRAAVGYLLSSMSQWLDVVVPRGGRNLIQRVQDEARVPVIGHLEGVCHVYVHGDADIEMACEIAVNAKMRRTGICGAAETLLVDRSNSKWALPAIAAVLRGAGCELRGDEAAADIVDGIVPATAEDWGREYLDAVIAIRIVDDIDHAIDHIAEYGSGHTECIVTENEDAAAHFLRRVDSAILLHNASTQFADGGEFGMGAEIGIATGRIHARGPVGAEQLTSYKYLVHGNGQIRP